MAGDWIKMRADLFTHPKVVRIMSALKADRLRTVGGLMSVWCLFDAHSEDGRLDGYTPEALDELIGWPGFSTAMASVGWLVIEPQALVTPRFSEHNGQSAKRRAQDTERKRMARDLSASEADEMRTREEKRREEKNSLKTADPPLRVERPSPPDFDGKNVEALNGKSVVPIATGWELPDDWGIDAEALGWKPGEVLREAERFRQYWVAGKGQGTRRSVKGWRQSWSNWLSKAAEKQR
jgi:hypothetical protein